MATGYGKECMARVTKQRDMSGGDEFPFTLESIALGVDEDGDEVTSAVVVYLDQLTGSQKAKETAEAIATSARIRSS